MCPSPLFVPLCYYNPPTLREINRQMSCFCHKYYILYSSMLHKKNKLFCNKLKKNKQITNSGSSHQTRDGDGITAAKVPILKAMWGSQTSIDALMFLMKSNARSALCAALKNATKHDCNIQQHSSISHDDDDNNFQRLISWFNVCHPINCDSCWPFNQPIILFSWQEITRGPSSS